MEPEGDASGLACALPSNFPAVCRLSWAEDDSLTLRLLADIRDVWSESEPKIFTAGLLQRLKKIEDGPWALDERFDGRRLSRLLRPFGIKAATVRVVAETRKGYAWKDAEAAFARYLVSQPSQPA